MKFYKCSNCQNIFLKVTNQDTDASCCRKVMEELVANSVEASQEKHIPAVRYEGGRLFVQVGEVLHPMLPEHHIVFIAVEIGDLVLRKTLTIGDEPKAIFEVGNYHGDVTIYEYCNIHGLWKKELKI